MKIFLLFLLLLFPAQTFAQQPAPAVAETSETPTAEPAAAPETIAPEMAQGPVVLELFTSQACVFCPKADTLLGDLSSMKNIIAMSCHVDYYDVSRGSLAEAFCSKRQHEYAATLHAGPTYTPQMVINGAYDAVGYRLDDITRVVRKASRPGLSAINIRKADDKFRYQVMLPDIQAKKIITNVAAQAQTGVYNLWIAMIDKPHALTIAEGGNKGKSMRYYNVVSDLFSLGQWDGRKKTMLVNVKTLSRHHSFVVLAQKPGGEIFAAGRKNVVPAPSAVAPAESGDELFDFFGFLED